jgi:hypothetical protein
MFFSDNVIVMFFFGIERETSYTLNLRYFFQPKSLNFFYLIALSVNHVALISVNDVFKRISQIIFFLYWNGQ